MTINVLKLNIASCLIAVAVAILCNTKLWWIAILKMHVLAVKHWWFVCFA